MAEGAPFTSELTGLTIERVDRSGDGAIGFRLRGDEGGSYLRVGDAGWRLRDIGGAVSDGSYDEDAAGASDITGRRVAAVTVTAPDTTIALDDGRRIEILATSADHPAWYWFAPDGTCLVVGPGERWARRRLDHGDPLLELDADGRESE